jgi:hypothetical protein
MLKVGKAAGTDGEAVGTGGSTGWKLQVQPVKRATVKQIGKQFIVISPVDIG